MRVRLELLFRFRRTTACVALALLLWCGWRAFRASAGVPTLAVSAGYSVPVVDRNGIALRDLPSREGTRGQPVPLAQVSPRLLMALQVSEDRNFREHDGVDRSALLRAVAQNVTHFRRVSGASTLTQQLVKSLDNSSHRRTFSQKLWEMARAQNLEAVASKDAILEVYVNRLGFGHGLVGVDAAARGYFGVPPSNVSWAEAAFLAVLPRAPSRLDPYRHKDRAVFRQRALLRALRSQGLLSDAELATALAEPVETHPLPPPPQRGRVVAAAFSAFPHGEIAQRGRRPVALTLDGRLQSDAEAALADARVALSGVHASALAAIVVDNETSDVLAWVSAGDAAAAHVDLALAKRSPGSLFKPFVYGLAFQEGRSPDELLADTPVALGGRAGTYAPQNFDGTSRGLVPARAALAESLNLPLLRLTQELTLSRVSVFLGRMGFPEAALHPESQGLPLVLGSVSVSLAEVAAAYAALARGGIYAPLRFERDAPRFAERRMSRRAAQQVTAILEDPHLRLPLLHGVLDVPFAGALKTGTSTGFHDAWAVLYTRQRTVAVWVGNASGAPMASGATGARLAVPVATRLMLRAADRLPAAAGLGPLPTLGALAQGSAHPPAHPPAYPPAHPPAHPPALALRIVEPPMGGVVQSSANEGGVHVHLALPPGAAGAVVVIDGRHRFNVGPTGRAFLRTSPGDHELVAYGGEATAVATVRFALR